MKTIPISLCVILAGGVAFAQGPDGREPEGRDRRPDPGKWMGEFIRNADKDGDRAVSREEFNQLERIAKLPADKQEELFKRLDKNGDGSIRMDEMAGPPSDRSRRPHLDLRGLDEDHNGSVSFEEFLKSPFVQRFPEERRRPFFDRLDTNGDGKLSPEDRPTGRPDRRPDGRPGGRPDDRGPRPGGRDGFDLKRLDGNEDGAVDFEEFTKAPWIKDLGEDAQEDRFEAMDKDGNLKLEGDELSGPTERRKHEDGPGPKREREVKPDA